MNQQRKISSVKFFSDSRIKKQKIDIKIDGKKQKQRNYTWAPFFCIRWARKRKGNSLCLCCRYIFFFGLFGSFCWWIVCYAGAAFLYMNAINCGILQATNAFRTTILMQFFRRRSFCELILFSFFLHLFLRDSDLLFFFGRIQTHNEFWMVVAKAMMRLNTKIAWSFFSRVHSFDLKAIFHKCIDFRSIQFRIGRFYYCIIKLLHVFLLCLFIFTSWYIFILYSNCSPILCFG